MAAIGITPEFQDGTCKICKEKKPVRILKKGKRSVGICANCTATSNLTVEQLFK